jgi:hypothetical protein
LLLHLWEISCSIKSGHSRKKSGAKSLFSPHDSFHTS